MSLMSLKSLLSEAFDFRWEPNAPRWTGPAIDTSGDYDLAVIEFDDQGWYHDPSVQDKLACYLRSKQTERLSIIVFVHGWRHNACAEDRNLEEFRKLLQYAANIERHSPKPCRVFGVYLAWRGMSLRGLLGYGTFWTRKNAAFRVAVGSVREVLASLRRHQRDCNCHPRTEEEVESGNGTRLVLAGHSFGGLILFSAVAEYLIDSVVRPRRKVVRPFGDLIILVNPAFEATRYQPLATAILARRGFAAGQRVCFVAITAKNDQATRKAFPFGRWLGSRFESIRRSVYPKLPPGAQREANLNTVGHLPWLTTHRLTAPDGANAKLSEAIAKGWQPSFAEEDRAFEAFNETWRSEGSLKSGWCREYTSGASLTHVDGHPDNPFWVVEASREVINGHNGIFCPVFLGFLRQVCDDRVRRKLTASPRAQQTEPVEEA